VIISLGLRPLLSAGAALVNLPPGASAGTVTVTVSPNPASAVGTSERGALAASNPTTLALGKVSIAANTPSVLRIRLTRFGRVYLRGKRSAKMILVAQFRPAVSITKKTFSKTKGIRVKAK
jgi:hypothetical protein